MRFLKGQLKQAGASAQEAAELAKVAERLAKVKPKGMSRQARIDILQIVGETEAPRQRPVFWIVSSVATATFAIALVALHVYSPPSAPMTQQDVTSDLNDAFPAEQLAYLDDLAEEREAELKSLKKQESEPQKIEAVDEKYRNAFEEFWNTNRYDNTRRSLLWRKLYNDKRWDWLREGASSSISDKKL